MRPTRRTVFICSLAAALLAGCATPKDIAEQATKGNKGIEDANNKEVLLNALRAYKHRPMYFSSISSFTGPLGTANPQFTLGIPFGPGGQNTTSSQFTGNAAVFTLNVLDGQKFTNGITTPTKPEFMQYLLDQGWATQFVLSLMIREIIYETKDDKVLHIVNYPGLKAQYYQFQDELRAMVACGLKVDAPDDQTQIGPKLPRNSVSRLRDLVDAAKEKLKVAPVLDKEKHETGEWILSKPKSEVGLKFTRINDQECKRWVQQRARLLGESLPLPPLEQLDASERMARGVPGWDETECSQWQAAIDKAPREKLGIAGTASEVLRLPAELLQAREVSPHPENSTASIRAGRRDAGETTKPKPNVKISLFVRSPEAIIYYLGELIRAELDGPYDARPYVPTTLIGPNRCGPIFKVATTEVAKPFVTVNYDDNDYFVASAAADRSSQTVTLVSMLVNLQKEASDIPQTTLIRVVP